jgi:hypothetical protein
MATIDHKWDCYLLYLLSHLLHLADLPSQITIHGCVGARKTHQTNPHTESPLIPLPEDIPLQNPPLLHLVRGGGVLSRGTYTLQISADPLLVVPPSSLSMCSYTDSSTEGVHCICISTLGMIFDVREENVTEFYKLSGDFVQFLLPHKRPFTIYSPVRANERALHQRHLPPCPSLAHHVPVPSSGGRTAQRLLPLPPLTATPSDVVSSWPPLAAYFSLSVPSSFFLHSVFPRRFLRSIQLEREEKRKIGDENGMKKKSRI